MQVEKNEMQLNYHEQSRCEMQERKMTYLHTWGLGPELVTYHMGNNA
jgi:hypothetical protein